MCVKLAISNDGTLVDEDIDVTLRLPRDSFQSLEEMPQMNEGMMEYLARNCDMTTPLGISVKTAYSSVIGKE